MKARIPTAAATFYWTITASLVFLLAATLYQAWTIQAEKAEYTHWLNTTSDVRHNSTCRYFEKTAGGQPCKPDEGFPCGLCGG